MLDRWIMVLGYAIGAAGMLLVAAALFRDRARGRRRCPRCWYDMSSIAGMVCPECGRTAKKETSFFRTRRRWGRGALGVMVLMIGVGAAALPGIRERGWLSAVPTRVLVYFTPTIEEEDAQSSRLPVAKELRKRFDDNGFTDREWQVILERSRAIITRERWPTDRPLAVELRVPRWLVSNCNLRATARLASGGSVFAEYLVFEGNAGPYGQPSLREVGSVTAGTSEVLFDVDIWVHSNKSYLNAWSLPPAMTKVVVRLPVQAVGTPDEAIVPVDSKEANEAVRRALALTPAERRPQTTWLALQVTLDPSYLGKFSGMAVSFDMALVRNTGGTGVVSEVFANNVGIATQYCIFPELSAAEARTAAGRAGWSLHLRGTPRLGLVAWDKDAYWAGELTIPLDEIMTQAEP